MKRSLTVPVIGDLTERFAAAVASVRAAARGLALSGGQTEREVTHPFDYLAVLVSIVLGLGIAHILSAFARAVDERGKVVLYWPALSWAFTVLIIIVQVWWADFSLNSHRQWTFAAFGATLLIPAILYLMASFILPHAHDMRAAYERNRAWFFGALITLIVSSMLQQQLLDGYVHRDIDTALKFGGIALAAVCIAFAGDVAQRVLAVVGLAYILGYVALLFSALPQG